MTSVALMPANKGSWLAKNVDLITNHKQTKSNIMMNYPGPVANHWERNYALYNLNVNMPSSATFILTVTKTQQTLGGMYNMQDKRFPLKTSHWYLLHHTYTKLFANLISANQLDLKVMWKRRGKVQAPGDLGRKSKCDREIVEGQ